MQEKRKSSLILCFGIVFLIQAGGIGWSQTTERVSVDSAGIEGNDDSFFSSVSSDGGYVAFDSNADNLVANDTNAVRDIFVHDRQTGVTTRVSVDSAGAESNNYSQRPSISADGRYVAFQSAADNLVANDTNGSYDVFVHDRQTGATTRVSVDSAGVEGNDMSQEPHISSDGRYVGFYSHAGNLVANDTNGTIDAFIHDRQTGVTTRVSVDSAGVEGNSNSVYPSISSDGRYVTFYSNADNLVADDTNASVDVFIHDRQTGSTTRVSVDSAGIEGNGDSGLSFISADGGAVVFYSNADNLVANDTNGFCDIFVHELPESNNGDGDGGGGG